MVTNNSQLFDIVNEKGDDELLICSLIKIDNIVNHSEFIPIIVKWFYDEWYTSYLDFGLDNLDKAIFDFEKSIQRENLPVCYVGYINNTVVGTIGLDFKDTPNNLDHIDKGIPWVVDVFVSKDFRNKGVAKELIKFIIEKAKELKFDSLYLWTVDQQDLYKQFGWVEIEKIMYLGELYSLMLNKF